MLAATGPSGTNQPGAAPVAMRLRVNPIDCVGHGLCAELLPEWIGLDEWGYPILNDPELPPELVEHARRAANRCPTLALLLDPDNA
jgi:ferredoxin